MSNNSKRKNRIAGLLAAMMLSLMWTAGARANGEDIFEKIVDEPTVQSTYVSGRASDRKKWTARSGAEINLSNGFSRMYTYKITNADVVTRAREILNKYVKTTPGMELVIRNNKGGSKDEVYYLTGDDGKIYQVLTWYGGVGNVEIAVVDWDRGYGNGDDNQTLLSERNSKHRTRDVGKGEMEEDYTEDAYNYEDENYSRNQRRNGVRDGGGDGTSIYRTNHYRENYGAYGSLDGNVWKPVERVMTPKSGLNQVVNSTMAPMKIAQGKARVEISGPEYIVSQMRVKQEGKVLAFSFEGEVEMGKAAVMISVTLPDIESIEAKDMGSITVENLNLSGKSLVCHLSGTGDFNMGDVKAAQLTLRNSGTGDMTAGVVECDIFETYLAGTGDISIKQVRADRSDIMLAGTGDTDIRNLVGDTAYIFNGGTGDIDIRGKCDNATVTNNGMGDINVSGLKTYRLTTTNNGFGTLTK